MIKSLTIEEVQEYELELDSAMSGLPLPTGDRASAVWYVLTAIEDWIRLAFLRLVDDEDYSYAHTLDFMFLVNDSKYALRHALKLLHRQLPRSSKFDEPTLREDRYTKACDLLLACQEYETAVRAVISFRNRGCECLVDTKDGTLTFARSGAATITDALEVLLTVRDDESIGYLDSTLVWLANPDQWPPVVTRIVSSSVSVSRLKRRYTYNSLSAKELQSQLTAGPEIIPEGWSFSWGSGDEVRRCLHALVTRCVYHLIAVAAAYRQQSELSDDKNGNGVGSLCLVIGKQRLARQIRDLSEVALDRVLCFLDILTFGHTTTMPDPSLQPLIPVDDDVLLLAPLQVVSSNIERNLLSLQTRVDSKHFNANSHLFEKRMVHGFAGFLRRRYPHFRTNVYVPNRRQAGEVDLICADSSSRTIAVGEMRWMHATGDAGEVQNRKKVIGEKVEQLEPKVSAVREQIYEVLMQLGLRVNQDEADEWLVVGMVIVEGFYGRVSADADQMIVAPRAVLEIGIESASNLRSLCNWLASRSWLPQEGLHFSNGTRECDVGETRIIWGGINLLSSHTSYLEFVKASCLAAN
jgi:hypothetical protein